jgi:hypothetical protein
MYKNLVAHEKDEDMYRRHLFAFKKAFPNFIYNSLDNSEPLNLTKEVSRIIHNLGNKGTINCNKKLM